MEEDFLHYIWKYNLYDKQALVYKDKKIEILSVGEHNFDAGPDFFNAQIVINNTTLVGNIEIHKKSSDWNRHKHNIDKAYDNVILHLVYENDTEIQNTKNEIIPTVELKFDIKLRDNYLYLKHNKQVIACNEKIKDISDFTKSFWIQKLFIERLEYKSNEVLKILELTKNNWEETFYIFLAKNFGFKLNSLPFQMLAKSLPLIYLAKHKNNIQQVEALLFGTAGFLDEEYSDEYPIKLEKEYAFFKNKFKLQGIEKHLWKFLRLRPSNFPTIRISQFANLIYKSNALFSKIIEAESIDVVKRYFDISATNYWDTHYVFDKVSIEKKKRFGNSSQNIIIINTVIPFLFIYGKVNGIEKYQDKAIRYAEQLISEKNSIITEWKDAGIISKNAFESQSLIHLYNNYCKKENCLKCQFGSSVITG